MDFIGFGISLIALVFLFFKNRSATKQKGKNEEAEVRPEEPADNPLHDFLKAIEERENRRALPVIYKAPPTVPKKRDRLDERRMVSPLQNKHLVSEEEQRHLTSPLKSRYLRSNFVPVKEHEVIVGPSKACLAIDRLHSKQDLLIYHEIFGKPKGLL